MPTVIKPKVLFTLPDTFYYTAGAASSSFVFLGNTLINDSDPFFKSPLYMNTITKASFVVGTASAKLAGLSIKIVDGVACDANGATITVTDSLGTAYIVISSAGNEYIYDPKNIFKALNSSDLLEIDLSYTIKNRYCITGNDSQKLFIHGVANRPPTDGNETYVFNEDTLEGKTTAVTPTKLANASDPDGDPLHIGAFGLGVINLTSKYSLVQSGSTGVYTLTYLANPGDKALITILADGTETVQDMGALKHLAVGQELDIVIYYTVMDNHGGSAPQSYELMRIFGQNDAPTDGNEVYTFTEDALEEKTTAVTPTKLANAFDPDGDPLSISSFGSGSINLVAKYSLVQSGSTGVYTLTYLANPADKAIITILSDGTETIQDMGALKHLAVGQELDITVNYTVSDNHGASAPPIQ